jgi:hypothetical protein
VGALASGSDGGLGSDYGDGETAFATEARRGGRANIT